MSIYIMTLGLFSCIYAQSEQGTCGGLQTLISRRNINAVGTCTANHCTVECTTPAAVSQSINITFFPCTKEVNYIQLLSGVNVRLNTSTSAVTYMTPDENGNVMFTLIPTGTGVDFGVSQPDKNLPL